MPTQQDSIDIEFANKLFALFREKNTDKSCIQILSHIRYAVGKETSDYIAQYISQDTLCAEHNEQVLQSTNLSEDELLRTQYTPSPAQQCDETSWELLPPYQCAQMDGNAIINMIKQFPVTPTAYNAAVRFFNENEITVQQMIQLVNRGVSARITIPKPQCVCLGKRVLHVEQLEEVPHAHGMPQGRVMCVNGEHNLIVRPEVFVYVIYHTAVVMEAGEMECQEQTEVHRQMLQCGGELAELARQSTSGHPELPSISELVSFGFSANNLLVLLNLPKLQVNDDTVHQAEKFLGNGVKTRCVAVVLGELVERFTFQFAVSADRSLWVVEDGSSRRIVVKTIDLVTEARATHMQGQYGRQFGNGAILNYDETNTDRDRVYLFFDNGDFLLRYCYFIGAFLQHNRGAPSAMRYRADVELNQLIERVQKHAPKRVVLESDGPVRHADEGFRPVSDHNEESLSEKGSGISHDGGHTEEKPADNVPPSQEPLLKSFKQELPVTTQCDAHTGCLETTHLEGDEAPRVRLAAAGHIPVTSMKQAIAEGYENKADLQQDLMQLATEQFQCLDPTRYFQIGYDDANGLLKIYVFNKNKGCCGQRSKPIVLSGDDIILDPQQFAIVITSSQGGQCRVRVHAHDYHAAVYGLRLIQQHVLGHADDDARKERQIMQRTERDLQFMLRNMGDENAIKYLLLKYSDYNDRLAFSEQIQRLPRHQHNIADIFTNRIGYAYQFLFVPKFNIMAKMAYSCLHTSKNTAQLACLVLNLNTQRLVGLNQEYQVLYSIDVVSDIYNSLQDIVRSDRSAYVMSTIILLFIITRLRDCDALSQQIMVLRNNLQRQGKVIQRGITVQEQQEKLALLQSTIKSTGTEERIIQLLTFDTDLGVLHGIINTQSIGTIIQQSHYFKPAEKFALEFLVYQVACYNEDDVFSWQQKNLIYTLRYILTRSRDDDLLLFFSLVYGEQLRAPNILNYYQDFSDDLERYHFAEDADEKRALMKWLYGLESFAIADQDKYLEFLRTQGCDDGNIPDAQGAARGNALGQRAEGTEEIAEKSGQDQ